jgi:hypothetical protein
MTVSLKSVIVCSHRSSQFSQTITKGRMRALTSRFTLRETDCRDEPGNLAAHQLGRAKKHLQRVLPEA